MVCDSGRSLRICGFAIYGLKKIACPLPKTVEFPLRIRSGIQKEVRVIPGTAELTVDSSFILMFSYYDISVYFSPHFVLFLCHNSIKNAVDSTFVGTTRNEKN